jgi:hypothetical protein
MTVSGSERYDAWLSAPVLTLPPTLRSFGMPPARMPASCGGPDDDAPSPPSLLLLPLEPGAGGASPPTGGLVCMPGTGGAPPGTGGAPLGLMGGPSETFPTIGADRSLTFVTFFKRAPCSMLLSSAPWDPESARRQDGAGNVRDRRRLLAAWRERRRASAGEGGRPRRGPCRAVAGGEEGQACWTEAKRYGEGGWERSLFSMLGWFDPSLK